MPNRCFSGAVKTRMVGSIFLLLMASGFVTASAAEPARTTPSHDPAIGRIEISTIPFDPNLTLRSATYTPSGKVLVSYAKSDNDGWRDVNLAVMNDDGSDMRPFFSHELPRRPKSNGIRYMVFPDNRRIFLGDFILECAPTIDSCDQSALLPVKYPDEVSHGDNISHRWSEMIVAPDNEHIAWTTLLSNGSAVVLTGKLKRGKTEYEVVDSRIISTLDEFRSDPAHRDGVIPNPVRGGEVKQFVEGGTAISMVGAKQRVTPDSVVQDLPNGNIEQITHNPGYDETTIFSPDEKLGITMTTRFSKPTNMAILGLMPRPYPVSLNMGLSMYIYTYSVTGVRKGRAGNVGPALIDIQASKSDNGYQGVNLHTGDGWVYYSPMSWAPDGKKAMWLEGRRDGSRKRIQVVRLADYRPAPAVAANPTPDDMPYAISDLSAIDKYVRKSSDIDVKVYGRHSGYIQYRRTMTGMGGTIEKRYVDYSDDGQSVYTGSETMRIDPRGRSTYTANVKLAGPRPGVMNLKITFGPLGGELPAKLVFARDQSGQPLTHGFAEYGGRRLNVDRLVP